MPIDNSRSGQRGQSASTASIRSIHASTDELRGERTYATPPLAANGAASQASCLGAEFVEDVIEHGFTVEEHKVSPDLLQVERLTIGSHKLTDIVDIAQTSGIVYVGLKLESNKSLGVDYAQATHPCLVLGGAEQQLHGFGATGVEQVEPFVTAQIVGGIFTAMDAVVAQGQHDRVETVGVVGVDQEIDIAGGANNVVYGQRESTDQRWRRFYVRERGERFLHLVD
ncbi:MAG: hypothetical protein WBP11_10405 [Dokdonella sp.]